MNMIRCVNCSLLLKRPLPRRQVGELTETMFLILGSWIRPTTISESDFLCQECYNILQRQSIETTTGSATTPIYGHKQICLACGKSILRGRTHKVLLNTPERDVILSSVPLHQVQRLEKVCLCCWTAAFRSVQRRALADENREEEDTMEEEADNVSLSDNFSDVSMTSENSLETESLIPMPPPLPTYCVYVSSHTDEVYRKINSHIYKRAAAVSRHCIFKDCQYTERLLVPSVIKEMLVLKHKLYIPNCARICRHHLNVGNWHKLTFTLNDFTGAQMDDMMTIMNRASRRQLDLSNISNMDQHLCHYWLGITSEQFHELLSQIPQLRNHVPCPSIALSLLLVKLRTGDSNDRLSTLFQLPRSTLERYMNKARHCLGSILVCPFTKD